MFSVTGLACRASALCARFWPRREPTVHSGREMLGAVCINVQDMHAIMREFVMTLWTTPVHTQLVTCGCFRLLHGPYQPQPAGHSRVFIAYKLNNALVFSVEPAPAQAYA